MTVFLELVPELRCERAVKSLRPQMRITLHLKTPNGVIPSAAKDPANYEPLSLFVGCFVPQHDTTESGNDSWQLR